MYELNGEARDQGSCLLSVPSRDSADLLQPLASDIGGPGPAGEQLVACYCIGPLAMYMKAYEVGSVLCRVLQTFCMWIVLISHCNCVPTKTVLLVTGQVAKLIAS